MNSLSLLPIVVLSFGMAACPKRGATPSEPKRTKEQIEHPDALSLSDYRLLGDEVIRLVGQHFLNGNVEAQNWAERHAGYAAGIASRLEFAKKTNELLAELRKSHTRLFVPSDVDYIGIMAVYQQALKLPKVEYDSIGIDVLQTPDGYFVRSVFANGPAARAGVTRGDKLVSANNRDFDPTIAFLGHSGSTMLLHIQRRRDEHAMEVAVIPRRIDAREEWLDAQKSSLRIFEKKGKRIGYYNIFSCVGPAVLQTLLHDITETFQAQAEVLVLDFRNGWGGCSSHFLEFVNPYLPAITELDGNGRPVKTLDRRWRKPLFLLINAGTRSAKEVVAFSLKRHSIATLVGERTAGAVVSGTVYWLADRSILALPVDEGLIDGERLEGKGVEPHVMISDYVPYSEGHDAPLEKALDLAMSLRTESPDTKTVAP